MTSSAFLSPPGARLISRPAAFTASTSPRRRAEPTPPLMVAKRPSPQRLGWLRVALITAGGLAGAVAGPVPSHRLGLPPVREVHAATTLAPAQSSNGAIPLRALGIKRDDYVGERELRRRKTTQYSEAEEEIMELEEWEVATQWFRDLQMTWAALASLGGIFVLYKGGVMWEKWIQEQEKKDMEEEIELTGTFIDPRAVRKDEDEDDGSKQGSGGKPADGKGPSGDSSGDSGDDPSSPGYPSDGLESLEKLFGKS